MFGIFEKSFNEITFQDIDEMVTRNERESQFLDYKERFEKDDITADICAMANGQGGYIIIGISEKTKTSNIQEGYPEAIIGIDKADLCELIIREKTKDLIDPYIQGFREKILLDGEGREILLIQVPNSQMKPHFVRKSSKSPFPIRVGRTTSYWTMGDLRNIIFSKINTDEQIEKVLNIATANNINAKSKLPYISLKAIPTYFGAETINMADPEIGRLMRSVPGHLNEGSYCGMELNYAQQRFCYEGYESYQSDSELSLNPRRFLRLHRTGLLEYTDTDILLVDSKKFGLHFETVCSMIVHFAHFYRLLSEYLGNFDPVTFQLLINNIPGSCIALKTNGYRLNYHYLLTPDGCVDYRVTYPSAFEESISKDLSTRFFNAFGLPVVPEYANIKFSFSL